jgi:hypothetical protein
MLYGPYMTMAEIKAKYPDEWVFLANPTSTRYHEVTGGHVILHHANRAEYLQMVGEWDDPDVKHLASWYTGEPKDDLEIFPSAAETGPGAA